MSIASIKASLAITKERYARMYPEGGMGGELWSDDKTEHNRLIQALEAAICLCENQDAELAELRAKAAAPKKVWVVLEDDSFDECFAEESSARDYAKIAQRCEDAHAYPMSIYTAREVEVQP